MYWFAPLRQQPQWDGLRVERRGHAYEYSGRVCDPDVDGNANSDTTATGWHTHPNREIDTHTSRGWSGGHPNSHTDRNTSLTCRLLAAPTRDRISRGEWGRAA